MTTIATMIRDAAYTRLLTIGPPWKSTRKTPFPTLQENLVPALGVFMLRENMGPDGDSNVGPPRYISDVVIAFSVVHLASDPGVLEGSVDTLVDTIQDTLLCDPTFIDLRDANDKAIIDSIPAISRTYSFPNQGETYYLECRLQMTIRYFCFFEPIIPNALTTVKVHTAPFDAVIASHDAELEIDLPGV